MSEVSVKQNQNQSVKQNNQNQDNGNFNFGQIVGQFGKFSRFNQVNGKDVLNFSISIPKGFGWYDYVPMTAWGQLADELKDTQPRTMLGLGYSLHNSSSKVTTQNGHQMTVPQVNAFKTYSQLNGYYNQGGLSGNFSKFSTYKLVGKNNDKPMLQFKLSVRDYNGDFENYRLVAWGKTATQIHKAVHFKDFIGVNLALGSDKLPLQNGHSLDIPELDVTGYKMLKQNSTTVSNPFKKPVSTDDSSKDKSVKPTKDDKDKKQSNKAKDDAKKSKKLAKKANKKSAKDSKKSNKKTTTPKDTTPKKNGHKKIDISDDDLPF